MDSNQIVARLTEARREIDIAIGILTPNPLSGMAPESKLAPVNESNESAPRLITRNNFKFGAASSKELLGVKAELVQTVRLALTLSTQDFCVYDGIRTLKEQQLHVTNGTSKTMKSKHLDGLAVDLVPWINGKPVWDWKGCYRIAHAMDLAATELGFAGNIRWGAAWDRVLSDFGGDLGSYEQESRLYAERHPGKDFLDGPHFEWVS
jgi:peptidoglycan L-alanyl-D-glutamate endopeptidase CwlK